MKRLIYAAIAIAIATPVAAQLYKWTDKDGKTHYSDTPPPGQESKSLSVGSGATTATPAPAGTKSAVERDKDAEAARKASRDASKKADDVAKAEADREAACTRAKSAHAAYAAGGRFHKYDEKGEKVYLGDAEIVAERARTQGEMEEACKKT